MSNRILRKIFQKNRLKQYADVLRYAKDKSYKLCSLYDWYTKYKDGNEKVLILRHDVDLDPEGAYNFFKIENDLGATSTFYFRWLTEKPNIIKKIHNLGFEVSLHFETLANYARKNKLFKQEQINDDIIKECRNILSEEILSFEKKYFKISTICSHGDIRNRILQTPNHVLTSKDFLKQHKILFETYDKNIISLFDAYISDSSIYSNFEWKHYGSPYTAISNNLQTICLLTHPIHWNQSLAKNTKMLLKIYLDNNTNLFIR